MKKAKKTVRSGLAHIRGVININELNKLYGLLRYGIQSTFDMLFIDASAAAFFIVI